MGESKVKGEQALGVRVGKDGKPDVDLWFSKQSALLLKAEFDGFHLLTEVAVSSRKTKHELYFSGYRSVAGIQTPERVEIINQVARITYDLSDTRYFERLDAGFFSKP